MLTLDGREFTPEIPKQLQAIAKEIQQAGGRSYLVGGWVRDAILGTPCRDFDVEVYELEQEVLLEILTHFGRPNLVGKAFGVIILPLKGFSLDISFPRTENKVGEGHRGFLVQTHPHLSFKEAAYRRDFTINSMGMELPNLILCDPYNGKEDLQKRILRHVGPAFAEDSLRILRGVQFASRFALSLAPETAALCRELTIEDLSFERIFEEFRKWFLKPGTPSYGLIAFLEMDLQRFFPEIKPPDGSWDLLGLYLDRLQGSFESLPEIDRLVLAFTVLLSESENETEVLEFLERISNEVKILQGVSRLWNGLPLLLPQKECPSDSFIRRLSLRLNGLVLAECYCLADPRYTLEQKETFFIPLMQRAKELGVFQSPPLPLLTGKTLMQIGLRPGKFFGEWISESFELQLDGRIQTEEDVLIWAQKKRATSI